MIKTLANSVCEEQVFSKMFQSHSNDLYNFLRYKFGGNLNPKDKVQEAFIKLWDNCKKVTPDKVKFFLFTTANKSTPCRQAGSPSSARDETSNFYN